MTRAGSAIEGLSRAKGTVTDQAQPERLDYRRLALKVVGAGLLIATGAIHLDLYLTGYSTIPTIGWLFLLQVIAAFALGFVVLASRSRMVAAAAAGFALSTLGGFLLSLQFGLFGFREVRTSAGIVAGIIEVVGFAVLATLALSAEEHQHAARPTTIGQRLSATLQAGLPVAQWTAAALSMVGALLLGLALAASGPTPTGGGSSRAILHVTKIHGVAVLTNAHGYTLYWFVPDTPTKSTCYGTCAAYWPPVTGSPVASQGVTGKLGTIRRSDGSAQVTYRGHPLYTYVGDSAPGQASGDNINLNGGFWHEMKVSG